MDYTIGNYSLNAKTSNGNIARFFKTRDASLQLPNHSEISQVTCSTSCWQVTERCDHFDFNNLSLAVSILHEETYNSSIWTMPGALNGMVHVSRCRLASTLLGLMLGPTRYVCD